MIDFHVVPAIPLEDGAVVWLTDKRTWVDRLEHATGYEDAQLDSAVQTARLSDQFSMLSESAYTSFLISGAIPLERWQGAALAQIQSLASSGTLLGHLTQNRQA